jgi:dienelactone hydrolase
MAFTAGFPGLTEPRSAAFVRVMKSLWTVLFAATLVSGAHAALVEKTVTYQQDDATLEGFHVYDDAVEGARPAVLVIHQWTGLTDYEKRRSRQLAELGYNVFAADIYGKGIRPKPPEAGQEAGKYKGDRTLYRARLSAALEQLKADKRTNPEKIAAIGYCFGGTGVLELARAGTDIAGVVSFHGGLAAADGLEAKAGNLPAEILVLHGADDPFEPAEEVAKFMQEMKQANADWQMNFYSGAVHAFTQKEAGDDASKGAAYNARADQRSWDAMKLFFNEIFK